MKTIAVCRGRKKLWRQVGFTQSGYGPVQVIGWWGSECDEPLVLVTNFLDRDEASQYLLPEDAPLPIAFLPEPTRRQIFVYKSAR